MQINNVSMTIVINGARGDITAREYISPHNRQNYIEGREGSNFTLRLHNKNNFRVLAIPSVDGLSVLDGKPAGEGSPGYVLGAGETLDIPGWKVDSGTAAKFFFAGLKSNGADESYVAQTGGDTLNKGLIGLKVFKERVVSHDWNYARGIQLSSTSPMFGAMGGSKLSKSAMRGVSMNNASLSCSVSSASASTSSMSTSAAVEPEVTQTLGTGFGEAQDFQTTKTDFKRGDLIAMMVIYYDDKRGLERVGINVNKPVESRPSAFPADETGCTPPAGWNR